MLVALLLAACNPAKDSGDSADDTRTSCTEATTWCTPFDGTECPSADSWILPIETCEIIVCGVTGPGELTTRTDSGADPYQACCYPVIADTHTGCADR